LLLVDQRKSQSVKNPYFNLKQTVPKVTAAGFVLTGSLARSIILNKSEARWHRFFWWESKQIGLLLLWVFIRLRRENQARLGRLARPVKFHALHAGGHRFKSYTAHHNRNLASNSCPPTDFPQKFCPKRPPASSIIREGDKMNTTGQTDPKRLIAGYQLCASTEGKSPNAIAIVITSVTVCFVCF
jgi:hypothetical protein